MKIIWVLAILIYVNARQIENPLEKVTFENGKENSSIYKFNNVFVEKNDDLIMIYEYLNNKFEMIGSYHEMLRLIWIGNMYLGYVSDGTEYKLIVISSETKSSETKKVRVMPTKHIIFSKRIYVNGNIIKDIDRNTIFALNIKNIIRTFTFKVYQAIKVDGTNKIYIVSLNDLYLYDAKLDELKIFMTNISTSYHIKYDSNFLVITLLDNTKIFVSQDRQIINTKTNENLQLFHSDQVIIKKVYTLRHRVLIQYKNQGTLLNYYKCVLISCQSDKYELIISNTSYRQFKTLKVSNKFLIIFHHVFAYHTILLISNNCYVEFSFDNGDSFKYLGFTKNQCISNFETFHELGISSIRVCSKSMFSELYINYDGLTWINPINGFTRTMSTIKLDTFTNYTIFYALSETTLWLSFDGMRSFHFVKDDIFFSKIVQYQKEISRYDNITMTNNNKFTTFIFSVHKIPHCFIKNFEYHIANINHLIIFNNNTEKNVCIIENTELKIERSQKRQCASLDYVCSLNYDRDTSHLCVGGSFNQTKKQICFNGKMQNIDLAGYKPIFSPSYYKKYCWPNYFNVPSNITCDDIKRPYQKILSKSNIEIN